MKTDAPCLKERDEHFIGRCGVTYALIVICSQKQKKKRKKAIAFLYCFHSIFIKQFIKLLSRRKYQYIGSGIVRGLTPIVTTSLFFSLKVKNKNSTSPHDIKRFQCAYKSVHKFHFSSPDKAQSLLVSSSDVIADGS